MAHPTLIPATDLKLWLGTVGNGGIESASTSLTAACSLTQADVGRPVWVLGTGADGAPHRSTIVSVEDADSCTIADAAPNTSPGYPDAGWALVIVWRPGLVLGDSIQFERSLTVRDALTFTCEGAVALGAPVIVGLEDADNLEFGGVVEHVALSNPYDTQDDIYSECSCVGWDYLLSKRVVMYREYSASPVQTCGAVFEDLADAFLVGDYVGISADEDGAELPEGIIFGWSMLSEALQRLVALSNTDTDTYYLYVDPYRVLHFAKQDTTAAPWNVSDQDGSDENILMRVTVERTNEKRKNRIFVHGTQCLGSEVTETFHGDGSAAQFSVAAPIGQQPTVTVNATAATVGIQGVDTGKDWYWNQGSNTIYQDEAGTVLVEADALEITYRPYVDKVVRADDTDDQTEVRNIESGQGVYDGLITITVPATEEGLTEIAEAAIEKYKGQTVSVAIETPRSGLAPGQGITVAIGGDFNISGSFLIDQVSLIVRNSVLWWKAHAVSSASLIGDWKKAFIDLPGDDTDTGGAGGGAGGGQGGIIPPPPVQWDWIQEPLIGTVDGVNCEFTTTWVPRRSPKTGNRIIHIQRNQVMLDMFAEDATTYSPIEFGQFSIEKNLITFEVAPKVGDRIRAHYPPSDETQEELASEDRTGVWLARPTAWLAAYDQNREGEDVDGDFTPAAYLEDELAWGLTEIVETNSLRKYPEGCYYNYKFSGFNPANFELWQVVFQYTLHPNAYINGVLTCTLVEDGYLGETQILIGRPGEWHDYISVAGDGTNVRASEDFGYRDNDTNTIPADLADPETWNNHVILHHSMSSGPELGQVKTLDVIDQYFALYANAIRINCGSDAAVDATDSYPTAGALYTWGVDRLYTGGAAFATDQGGRWATGRKSATEFTYTIARSLYASNFNHTRYKVQFGFQDLESDGAGQRVFNIYMNSTPLNPANEVLKLADYDIYAEFENIGGTKDIEFEFANYPEGQVAIRFEAVTGEALVNWITVMPMIPTGAVG